MQFQSLYFILILLPVSLAGYYSLVKRSEKAADIFLIGMSLVFYAFAGFSSLTLLIAAAMVNYLLALPLIRRQRTGEGITSVHSDDKNDQHQKKAETVSKCLLVCGILFDLGLLAYFKYANFFLENMNAVFRTDFPMRTLFLPLGISFYIFSLISWLVDTYHGKTGDVTLTDYLLYVTFFPKLTQGPILNIGRFLKSRKTRSFDYEMQSAAVGMFVLGMCKKIFLADAFGRAVSWAFADLSVPTATDMTLVMLAYTLQIYFDFSGYSDMAIAVGRMFGFDFPANFNSPYKADSVSDFWRRWHISLTTFFREYVYFPLGGSRGGTAKTYRNIMIVFLLSGLWHGANWTFVLWGAVHGICQITERLAGEAYRRIPAWVRRVLTFVIVNFLWLLFRSASVDEFRRACWHIFRYPFYTLTEAHLESYKFTGVLYILNQLGIEMAPYTVYAGCTVLTFAVGLWICFVPKNNQEKLIALRPATLILITALSVYCLLSMNSVSAFIYNNF